MPLLSWSNACLAILYESCYHPVFCASIDGRSSRFITSINPRNATSLHPSPLNLMIAFSTLSKYLILWPKGPLRRRLSEMYWAQGTPPTGYWDRLYKAEAEYTVIDRVGQHFG